MPADLIGARYQLHRELARTPSLAVYEAEDQRADTPTGIAVGLGGGREPRHGQRLLGRRMARTVHPHVVSTYHRGKDGNRTFVAFRRPSRTLATELASAPYPPNRVAQMGLDLSSALVVLHRAGIRLGSLHPGHVGIDADGAVRLSPWPLAPPPGGWGGDGAWSPPEIVAGAPPSIAGDVWSLGAVLLSSLVGTGPGQLSVAATEELADRLRDDANPVLVDAIGRSMVSDPSRRFDSARRMASALQGETVTRRQFIAAGVPRMSAGTRRLAMASAAVVGVLSATTVGVGLSSLGGSSIATGGGVDHRPGTTAPPAVALPPAAVGHRAAPAASAPAASAPKGAVALSAIPTSSPAARAGHVQSTTGTTGSQPVAADPPVTAVSPPATTTPTTTPTTSTSTTSARTTTVAPPLSSGSGNPAPSSDPGPGTATSGHGGSNPGAGTPYAGGLPINATHDHGGGGGSAD
jgi:hypothetical protein